MAPAVAEAVRPNFGIGAPLLVVQVGGAMGTLIFNLDAVGASARVREITGEHRFLRLIHKRGDKFILWDELPCQLWLLSDGIW